MLDENGNRVFTSEQPIFEDFTGIADIDPETATKPILLLFYSKNPKMKTINRRFNINLFADKKYTSKLVAEMNNYHLFKLNVDDLQRRLVKKYGVNPFATPLFAIYSSTGEKIQVVPAQRISARAMVKLLKKCEKKNEYEIKKRERRQEKEAEREEETAQK